MTVLALSRLHITPMDWDTNSDPSVVDEWKRTEAATRELVDPPGVEKRSVLDEDDEMIMD